MSNKSLAKCSSISESNKKNKVMLMDSTVVTLEGKGIQSYSSKLSRDSNSRLQEYQDRIGNNCSEDGNI